jgi:hypothetical protein
MERSHLELNSSPRKYLRVITLPTLNGPTKSGDFVSSRKILITGQLAQMMVPSEFGRFPRKQWQETAVSTSVK